MEMIKSFCQLPLVFAVAMHCGQLQAAISHSDVSSTTGIKLMLKTSEQESKLVNAQYTSVMGEWSLAYSADYLTVVRSLDSVAANYSLADLSVPSIEAIWTDVARKQIWLRSPSSLKVFQLGADGRLSFVAGLNLNSQSIHLSPDFGGLIAKTANDSEYQLMLLDRNTNSFAIQGTFSVPADLSAILLDLQNRVVLTGHESTETTPDVLNVYRLDTNTATLTSLGSLSGLTASWTGSKGALHNIVAKTDGYVVVHSRGLTFINLASGSQSPQRGVEFLQPFTKDSVSVITGDVVSVLDEHVLHNVAHFVPTGFDFISKYQIDGLADTNQFAIDEGKVYTIRSGVLTSHSITAVDKDVKSFVTGASQLHLPVALDASSGRNLQLPGGELVLLGDNFVSVMQVDSNERLRQTQFYQHNTNFTDSDRLHLLAASDKSFYVQADRRLFKFELDADGKLVLSGQSLLEGSESTTELEVLGSDSQFMLHSSASGKVSIHRLTRNGPVFLASVPLSSTTCAQDLVNAVFTANSAYVLSKNGCISQVSLDDSSLGTVKTYNVSVSTNARLELSAGLLILRDTTSGSSQVAKLGSGGELTWLAAQSDIWKNQQTSFSFGGRFHLTSMANQQGKIYETAKIDGSLLSPVNLSSQIAQIDAGFLLGNYLLLQDKGTLDQLDIFSINRSPVVQTTPDIALVNQGVSSSVDVSGVVIDEDNDPLTYRGVGQNNVTIQSNGIVMFPATLPAENGDVNLTAEDNNGFSVSFKLPYIVNKSPKFSGSTTFTVNQGADFLIDLKQNVSDPEGHSIRFESVNKVLSVSEAGMLSGRFNDVIARKDQIKLIDQLGAVSSTDVTVVVNAVPTFSGASSYSMVENTSFTLNLATLFKDAENHKLTFSATGMPAGLLLTDGQISGQATSAGVFKVEVKVADSLGATTTQTLTFTVSAAAVVASPKESSGGSFGWWALTALFVAWIGRHRTART